MPKTSRQTKRESKRSKRLLNEMYDFSHVQSEQELRYSTPTPAKLEAKTENQASYMDSIRSNTITYGMGLAGTGKTFIATSMACEMYLNGDIDKIIVSRPAVEAGVKLGALPGTLDEKLDPYMAPVVDVLNQRLGKSKVEYLTKRGDISLESINYMRGKTFDNAFIILDEAQNATPKEVMLMLTRLGKYSKLVINGDINQKDINGDSGMVDSFKKLKGMKSCGWINFGIDDIVRSDIVREILIRYAA